MQNQHVVAFKNHARREADAKWMSFRDPHGNLATPARNLLMFAQNDLTYEILRQVHPESILTLPKISKPV